MSYDELIAALALKLIEGAKEHVGDLAGEGEDEFEIARELAISGAKSGDGLVEDVVEALKKAKKPVIRSGFLLQADVLAQMRAKPEKTYTVEVVFLASDGFYTITRSNLRALLAEPDLVKRDKTALDFMKPARVGGTDECDLALVLDDQQIEERWGDFESAAEDLLADDEE